MRHPISGLKVQTDLLFACDAVLMGGRTYPDFAAAAIARPATLSIATGSTARPNTSYPARCMTPERNNTTVISGNPDRHDPPPEGAARPGHRPVPVQPAVLRSARTPLLDEVRLSVHPLFVSQATTADLLSRPSATAPVEPTCTLALTRRVADEKCRHAWPTAR
jgi:hypothetical protein